MIYKLLKNLLKYAGYEGWACDEGFFVIVFTVFNLIRANGLLSPRFFKKASGILQSPPSVRPSVRHAISS